MQNIILILLSVLIVIVIFIIYIGYRKVTSFEIRLQKLQLDLISLQNLFTRPNPRVLFNESQNQIKEFLDDNLDENLDENLVDQNDNDEDSDENSDEYSDEDSDEESGEESGEESDIENNIENNNVTDNSVLDINTNISEQEKDVLFQNVKQVDEIIVDTNQENNLESGLESSLENGIDNITNLNLEEILATHTPSDTKVVNIVKKKTRKVPNQKPSELEVGTERVSENNGKKYIVMQNKNGINRWGLIK